MLPLRIPNLFNGGLLKPWKGILLFGPLGNRKIILAITIANRARASLINVLMSTITSTLPFLIICFITYALCSLIYSSSSQEKKHRAKKGRMQKVIQLRKKKLQKKKVIALKPLNMEDIRQIKNQVTHSLYNLSIEHL